MLFSDGICTFYKVEEDKLVPVASPWYGEKTVGYSRFFSAAQAGNRIDILIRIWWDDTIESENVCVLQDGKQYQVVQLQNCLDEDGLKVTDVSLRRMNTFYDKEVEQNANTM